MSFGTRDRLLPLLEQISLHMSAISHPFDQGRDGRLGSLLTNETFGNPISQDDLYCNWCLLIIMLYMPLVREKKTLYGM